MHGAIQVNDQIKSVSAVKKRPSGHQQRTKHRRGGENVRWKRVTEGFDAAIRELNHCAPDKLDELVKVIAAGKKITVPVTRLVYFGHLTVTQGMAARRYADIHRKFERFHMSAGSRSARSANLEPARNSEDQELERIINRGLLSEYEAAAKVAKREYKRVMKVLDGFRDPITGRNFAKDVLDNLCLSDVEPPSDTRASIGAVLSMIAKEFGIGEKR
jgi:hypothetical protein